MRVLACQRRRICTGDSCQTCSNYFPVEGRLMGEEVFCYQCLHDYDALPHACNGCVDSSLFVPTEGARKYAARVARYLEDHPGASLEEARGHRREV